MDLHASDDVQAHLEALADKSTEGQLSAEERAEYATAVAAIEFISVLPANAWNRPARHSIFGPTNLLEMAHFSARHVHLHTNQLKQTIERCQQATTLGQVIVATDDTRIWEVAQNFCHVEMTAAH